MSPLPPWLSTALPLIVLGLVLTLRWRNLRRSRRLRLETLWVLPVIFIGLLTVVLVTTPPLPAGWAVLVGMTAIGAVAGWYRGRTMRIAIDPDTHLLSQRGAPAALLFVAVLILVRQGVRLGGEAVDATLATDALLGFGLGMIVMTRVEWFLRGRALLRAARGEN
jgi:hypothetical protein